MFSSYNKISPRKELQGPRPSALRGGNDSFKIKKSQGTQPPRPPPVVIHLKSPQAIHIKPEDYMNIVQQLTGKPPASLTPSTNPFSLSLFSSSSSSSTVFDPKYSSVSRMVDDLKIQGPADDENLEVKESTMSPNEGSHAITASIAQSNFSRYSDAFLPSPNVYSNWKDFGPIF